MHVVRPATHLSLSRSLSHSRGAGWCHYHAGGANCALLQLLARQDRALPSLIHVGSL